VSMAIPAATPARRVEGSLLRGWINALTPRRGFQLALGLIWLLDAALQYQPYMFTKTFVTDVLASSAGGNPSAVARPIAWASNIMIPHIAIYNAIFATIQLGLALGLFWRRSVKLALSASIVWSLAVWWFGEGLGGVLTGAVNPFTGAPGGVVLYALIALLVWPREEPELPGQSVATSGPLGALVPKVLVLSMWASFVYMTLQPINRNSTSLGVMVSGMDEGEPGWIRSMDHTLGDALKGNGTWLAVVFCCVFAFAGLGVFAPRLTRAAVAVGIGLGLAIWILEDFGGIFTGQGTDPNSGLLIVLLAALFWPRYNTKTLGLGSPAASHAS
jgi:hypothetical protein